MGKIKAYSEKIITPLFVMSLVSLLGMASYYYYRSSRLVPQYSAHLSSIAKKRGERIAAHIENCNEQIAIMAQSQEIQKWSSSKIEGDEFMSVMQKYADSFDFKNMLLISPKGELLFSLNDDKFLGLNLVNRPYNKSKLTSSFMRVMMSITPDISAFGLDPFINKQALYSSVPLFSGKALSGVLSVLLNEDFFSTVVHNYLGLGETGEVVVGKRTPDGTQIIVPTRNEPGSAFRKPFRFNPGAAFPLQKAVRGDTEIFLGIDYRGQEVLAATYYIPNANIGLVAKIDTIEIFSSLSQFSLMIYVLLFITLLFGVLALLYGPYYKEMAALIRASISTRRMHIKALVGLFLLSSASAVLICYHRYKEQSFALEASKNVAESLLNKGVDKLTHSLSTVSFLAQTMAADLNADRLHKEDIVISMKRDMNENEDLFGMIVAYKPHAYNEDTRLFAPYITRSNDAFMVKQFEQLHDYTEKEGVSSKSRPWYTEPLQKRKGMWLKPHVDPVSNKLVIAYSTPFYGPQDEGKSNPLGVVVAMYAINSMEQIVSQLYMGQTGYPFIISDDGAFLYHPIKEYIEGQKTIFSVAERQGDESLYSVGERMVKGRKGSEEFFDEKGGQDIWIYYKPVTETKWSLGILFSEQEIAMPSQMLHHLNIWFIIALVFAFTVVSALISLLCTTPWLRQLKLFALLSSAVFMVGLIFLWRQVQMTSTIEATDGVPITSKVSLDSFLNEMKECTERCFDKNAQTVPTGIFVHSWKFEGDAQLEVASNIWQNYADKTIPKGIYFPQSTTTKKELLLDENGKVEWHVTATLAQQFNYAQYPFDSQRINIILDNGERTKNIVLVPDIASYNSLIPTDLPGLNPKFRLAGYTIKRSFFNYEVKTTIDKAQNIKERALLQFSIIITRNLLNAFIVYLLPLLVVIFSLFAIFCATGKIGKTESLFVSLRGYTALLFALLVLHRTLRSNYPTGDVLYIEYLFFYTYLTILVLIVHGAIVQAQVKQEMVERFSPILKRLFWPVQLALWFITTVIIFY